MSDQADDGRQEQHDDVDVKLQSTPGQMAVSRMTPLCMHKVKPYGKLASNAMCAT